MNPIPALAQRCRLRRDHIIFPLLLPLVKLAWLRALLAALAFLTLHVFALIGTSTVRAKTPMRCGVTCAGPRERPPRESAARACVPHTYIPKDPR